MWRAEVCLHGPARPFLLLPMLQLQPVATPPRLSCPLTSRTLPGLQSCLDTGCHGLGPAVRVYKPFTARTSNALYARDGSVAVFMSKGGVK